MGVGFTEQKAADIFEEKSLEIQDAVLSTLMTKTKAELSTANDVEALKKVLAAKITKMFVAESKKNQIQVIISKFLIQ
jgi:flagellar basal body-associated protein FliL